MNLIGNNFRICNLDTVGVTGSIPVVRTISTSQFNKLQTKSQVILYALNTLNTPDYASKHWAADGKIAVLLIRGAV